MTISITDLETLLRDIVRASRVLQYYPSGHPQILSTLGQALRDLQKTVKAEQDLPLGVKEDGLYVGAHRVLPFERKRGPLGKNLFELGITEVMFLADIQVAELLEFLEYLAQDARRIWENGGVSEAAVKKKWHHIRISAREFSAGENEALIQAAAEEIHPEDLEVIAWSIVASWKHGWTQPEVTELVRIVAAFDRAGSFQALMATVGEEDSPSDLELVLMIGQIVSSLDAADHDFEQAGLMMIKELFRVSPKTLLEAFQSEREGERSLLRVIDSVDAVVLGDLVAQQIIAKIADTSEWLNVIQAMGRTRSKRKQILYGCLGSLQTFPDAAESLGIVEAAMRESSREEGAIVALLRGSSRGPFTAPASWQTPYSIAPLIRHAVELSHERDISGATRSAWERVELERLMVDDDTEGVLELLAAVADQTERGLEPAGTGIITNGAGVEMTHYLQRLRADQRSRFFRVLAAVEKHWKNLVTRLLDGVGPKVARELVHDIETAGIDPRELLVDVLRCEDPETIVSAARVLATVGSPDDRNVLLPLLHHGNHRVRIEIVRLLASIAPEELAERIPDIAEDPNPMVVAELLAHMRRVPGVVPVLVKHARKGWLRSVADDTAIAILLLVSQIGTESEKAEIAASVRTQSFSGKVASSRVRDEAKRLLEKKEEKHTSGSAETPTMDQDGNNA